MLTPAAQLSLDATRYPTPRTHVAGRGRDADVRLGWGICLFERREVAVSHRLIDGALEPNGVALGIVDLAVAATPEGVERATFPL